MNVGHSHAKYYIHMANRQKIKETKRRQGIYNGIRITGIKIRRFFAATF